ncbi:MAG: serine/threonine-protein kinase [Tahibacter sp.]
MTSGARFAQLRRLFEQVCDLPADQRREHLENTGSDTSLIAEVEALLAAETKSLQRAVLPVAAMLGAIPETEVDEGDRIGAWRLIRKLASGGMGAVYLAERADGHFQQQAAIKLLRGFPTEEALQRLAAERQILAGLQHPHIARLLDGGATPGGQPFLVMEYVDGVPIDVWCRQSQLDLRARLRLFRNVCRAVAFAHQRLVVHCDLKPSNVLVRSDGAPVLLDFGIARALGLSRETDGGATFYTPGYASPEQISGVPVSVASDVYSLGLILFELLSGRKARLDVDDRTVTQLGRAETRPSELALPHLGWKRLLRGDLDAIVLRATSERPALRYASADALAEDIERHLDLKPVSALAPTWRYRYGRLVRRRWPLFAAGAISALMACVFTWRILSERDRALAAEAEARLQARTANQVSDFLVSVFEFANPEKNPQKREITAREVLDEGAQRIGNELGSEPAVRARLSDVLGRAYWMLGQSNRAMELYEQAVTLWQDPAVQQPLAAADSMSKLAVLQSNNHLNGVAETTARAALALRQGRVPDDDEAMADSWNTLALTLRSSGKFEESEADFQRSLAIRTRLYGPDSGKVSAVLHNLGLLYLNQGKYQQAVEAQEKALAIKRREHGGDRHPDVLNAMENYATALSQAGRSREAIPLLHHALDLRRELDGGDSENVASIDNEIGSTLHDMGDFQGAAENYRESLRIRRQLPGSDAFGTVLPLNNLASALEDMGDYAGAEPLFRESLAIRSKSLPVGDAMIARAQNNLARLLIRAGNLKEARPLLEQAMATRLEKFGAKHVETAKSQMQTITLLRNEGRLSDAESAMALVDASSAHFDAPSRSLRERERALLALARQRPADALPAARSSYAAAQEAYGNNHSLAAASAIDLVEVLHANGIDVEARKLLAANADVVKQRFIETSPVRQKVLILQRELRCCGDPTEGVARN